jgi:hypothetical protein
MMGVGWSFDVERRNVHAECSLPLTFIFARVNTLVVLPPLFRVG